MEPINATVHVQADRIDVWSPTQDQSLAVQLAASQAGYDPKDVYAHTTFLGGAFGGGGGGSTSVTRQATEISKQLNRPVKVIWAREEDIAQDNQRAPNFNRFAAALGENGLPEALFTRSVHIAKDGVPLFGMASRPDYTISNMPYNVPNRHHERNTAKSNIPVATHRAPSANQNVFMIESFVDEMAIAGGWNPLEWRIKMTGHQEEWQHVLRTLKEKSGFRTDLPKGEGMGVAIVHTDDSFVGCCATVTVSRRGRLIVEKVVIVVDSAT